MSETRRVLLVDDEEIVGKRLRPALEKRGYEVEFFLDGAEAIRKLRERRYDIVVTDVRMEGVGGLDVLAAVQDLCPEARTILITGYARADLAREAELKGAFDLLAKPFRPSELIEVLERASRPRED